MQSRMRHRVSEFQKVLNRAKTEVASTERKTVTYVSFLMSAGCGVNGTIYAVAEPCKRGKCSSSQ